MIKTKINNILFIVNFNNKFHKKNNVANLFSKLLLEVYLFDMLPQNRAVSGLSYITNSGKSHLIPQFYILQSAKKVLLL